MTEVLVTQFTDAACPWAYSAEPFRQRMRWLYGERLQWRTCMVVLSESAAEYERRGYTPERQSEGYARMAREHGMPIDTRQRPRIAATAPACRAVVAARLHAPECEWPLLRALYLGNFAGGLLDDPTTIATAAREAGLDADRLASWMGDPAVEAAMRDDMRRAREARPAARVLDERLAGPPTQRRYTCPSFEFERTADGAVMAVPGFNLMGSYEVVLANLLPHVAHRPRPASVVEVLRWAGAQLATREVAVLCGIPQELAREELGRVAIERHVGADGFWTLAGVSEREALRAA
jgi:predicted DsbA family dithiol-disulfide isomerase